jgi:hypothetical protein
MDQRSICLFLAIKGLSARAIHSELVRMVGPNTVTYLTVAKNLRQWQFLSVPCDSSEEPPNTIIYDAILDALEKRPFSSTRELARLTCIPNTIFHRRLTRQLGFVVQHLR